MIRPRVAQRSEPTAPAISGWRRWGCWDNLHAVPPAEAVEELLGRWCVALFGGQMVRGHRNYGVLTEDSAAAVEQSTGEPQQIGGGGHQPPAGIREGRSMRPPAVLRSIEEHQVRLADGETWGQLARG